MSDWISHGARNARIGSARLKAYTDMANHLGIYSFSQSLADFLGQSYATFEPGAGGAPLHQVSFEALSSSDFNSDKEIKNEITVYLHRITTNNQLRNVRLGQPVGAVGLNLHYLLTVWADNVEHEQTLMGWAIRELHYHSFLDRSSLSEDAGWAIDEAISLVPEDLNTEEMSRIWDMARRSYRLSYPFLARIVLLVKTTPDETTPVVAGRFTYTDDLNEREP
jgi:hypothetical protein